MKHSFIAPLITAGLFALAGCSSTPTKVDTGAISAQTFNFIGTMPKPTPGYADQRQVVHTLVQQAIKKNLANKGITQVTNNGDVTVAYLIIVGNNASTVSINDYFGYRDDAQALHEKAFDAYTGSKVPNYFEAGTLVIDFIDPKTFKVLKRNFATQPVLRNLAEDARAERIQAIVDKILADLRVKA
jgi:hypothetical protein